MECRGNRIRSRVPRTKRGQDAIMIVVDHLTRMAHAIPCRISITAQETAELFVKEIFRLYGLPTAIVLDRGSQFRLLGF